MMRDSFAVEDGGASSVAPSLNGPAPAALSEAEASIAERLRAVVLLAGQVRSTPLSRSIQRSVLELPIAGSARVLNVWQNEVARLVERFEVSSLPIRLLINERAPQPTEPAAHDRAPISVEFDAGEYRGTGGALRDVAIEYEAEDWVLLASGGQLLVQPLDRIVSVLSRRPGDVRLVTHADGTPSGLMLVRCGVLGSIPSVGFVDFKEQALPRIAEHHPVQVIEHNQPVGVPTRTRSEYLNALYRYHASHPADGGQADPFMETWRPTFSVIEPGAQVDPQARIHDAVVLAGGRVEAGAVVTRSVVAESGRIKRNGRCVERIAAQQMEGSKG